MNQYGKSLEKVSNLKSQKLKDLNKKKADLRKYLETNLLETLKETPPNFPKELGLYWKHKEWDAISKSLNAKKIVIKEHENFLIRELGKKGKTLEWFKTTFKGEIK